jgi:hypothetical protein
MKVNKNYILYLKELDDERILSAISDYENKLIPFERLEQIAIEEKEYSQKVYEKTLKMKNILK